MDAGATVVSVFCVLTHQRSAEVFAKLDGILVERIGHFKLLRALELRKRIASTFCILLNQAHGCSRDETND